MFRNYVTRNNTVENKTFSDSKDGGANARQTTKASTNSKLLLLHDDTVLA